METRPRDTTTTPRHISPDVIGALDPIEQWCALKNVEAGKWVLVPHSGCMRGDSICSLAGMPGCPGAEHCEWCKATA